MKMFVWSQFIAILAVIGALAGSAGAVPISSDDEIKNEAKLVSPQISNRAQARLGVLTFNQMLEPPVLFGNRLRRNFEVQISVPGVKAKDAPLELIMARGHFEVLVEDVALEHVRSDTNVAQHVYVTNFKQATHKNRFHAYYTEELVNSVRYVFSESKITIGDFGGSLTEYFNANTDHADSIRLLERFGFRFFHKAPVLVRFDSAGKVTDVEILPLLRTGENSFAALKTADGYTSVLDPQRAYQFSIDPEQFQQQVKFVENVVDTLFSQKVGGKLKPLPYLSIANRLVQVRGYQLDDLHAVRIWLAALFDLAFAEENELYRHSMLQSVTFVARKVQNTLKIFDRRFSMEIGKLKKSHNGFDKKTLKNRDMAYFKAADTPFGTMAAIQQVQHLIKEFEKIGSVPLTCRELLTERFSLPLDRK